MNIKRNLNRIVSSYILQHCIFWIFSYCFFLFLVYNSKDHSFSNIKFINYIDIFVSNLIFAIPVYLNLFLFIPYIFRRKKYFIYSLLVIISVLLTTILLIYVDDTFFSKEVKQHTFNLDQVLGSSLFIMLYVSMTSFIKFMRDLINLQGLNLKIKEMEKQHLAIELKSLKEQVNPHFLFNTLNNIYSLSLDRSEKTPGLILKLSELIRYMIYDCTESFVDADKEIVFINNYIELEKIRLDEKVPINLKIFGNMSDCKIAPLLFIPFIENAFKHGLCRVGGNCFVNIDFDFATENMLFFHIENSKEIKPDVSDDDHKPIGIENARKRLELLYPDKYKLQITDKGSSFLVELSLEFE